jgi:hypothetical protein
VFVFDAVVDVVDVDVNSPSRLRLIDCRNEVTEVCVVLFGVVLLLFCVVVGGGDGGGGGGVEIV